LFSGNRVIATQVDPMSRGQAEHLMPMLEAFLTRHDVTWRDLTRIGVGVGPGNFTGIRISVSAARGLALGLDVPAIGVSTLEAIHRMRPDVTAAVAAPRDMIYVQKPGGTARIAAAPEVPDAVFATDPDALIAAIASCAADANAAMSERPRPLYIKAADAAPSRDTAPAILP
jgi:tRNA threonylcarbamoyl adenosine modification protein YeaZ